MEQGGKFDNIARDVMNHADYNEQVRDNSNVKNHELALKHLIKQALLTERKRELDLYKKYASDPDFERAFDASIARILGSNVSMNLFCQA